MLPWLTEATRRNPSEMQHLHDCEDCMGRFDQATRQQMGCGFEPALVGALGIWSHPGYSGSSPNVCPGYTTKLPEVRELTWARFYLHKGSLREWAGGEPAHPNVLRGIEELEQAENACDAWKATPVEQGGGKGA